MDSNRIKILLLGPPIVMCGEKLVKISRKQHRGLLYYLAAQSQPVSRAEVCDLFWPNEPEGNSRKRLREALSRIKNEVGEPDMIYSIDDQLMLDYHLVFSDKREYDRIIEPLLNNAAMTSNGSLSERMVLELMEVMSLCRSAQFLQGVQLSGSPAFENWVELTNQRYEFTRLKIIDRLADHCISVGDFDGAILWLDLGLESDRANVEMNYLMLTCLRDMGKFQQMVDYINFLEGFFKENDEPFPKEFYELRKKAEISRKTPDFKSQWNWPDSREEEVRFFGRKAELEQIGRAMRKKGILLIEGEAGSGKTRLVKEFILSQAYAPRLLYCTANPLTSKVPFQSIIEGLTKEIQAGEWELLNPEHKKTLLAFYRMYLQNKLKTDAALIDLKSPPFFENVYAAFMKLLEIMSIKRPLFFVIDDAQWLDNASIAALRVIASTEYSFTLGLMVLIKRIEDENPSLEQTIRSLTRQNKISIMKLNTFSEREAVDFINAVLGKKAHADLEKRVIQGSGGNPFYLIECLRLSSRYSALANNSTNHDTNSAREVIMCMMEEKLALLNTPAVEVIQAAAVLGNQFFPDILQQMVEIETGLFIKTLEKLTSVGVLKTAPDLSPAGGYEFCHGVEREFIETGLSPARSQYLHQKAANCIIKNRGKQPELSATLAAHFEKAADPTQAVKWWLEAGHYYRSIYSKTDASHAYERAAYLVRQNPYLFSIQLIYQVFSEWGNYAYDQADAEYSEDIFNCCLEVGELRTDPLLIGTGLSGLGRAAGMYHDYERAHEYFTRAIFYLRRTDQIAELSELYSRMGIVWFDQDEYVKAKEAFEEGLSIAGEVYDDPCVMEARINNLTELSAILIYEGWPQKAFELVNELAGCSKMVTRRSALLQLHAILALTYYSNGCYSEAIKLATECKEFADKLKVRYWQSLVDLILGESYLMVGNLDKAWQYTNLALEREEEFTNEKLYYHALLSLGNIYRVTGMHGRAEEIYKTVINNTAPNIQSIESRLYLGVTLTRAGNLIEGREWFERTIDTAAQAGLKGLELHARITKAILFSKKKKLAEFQVEIESLVCEICNRGPLFEKFFAEWILAIADEKENKVDQAIEKYRGMIKYCQEINSLVLEIVPLQRIMELVQPASFQYTEIKNRFSKRLKDLARNATIPPVKGLVKKLRINTRKNWQYFVNDEVV